MPEDVAVIGLGDYFMSDHAGTSLSTVREPVTELGRLVAEVMFEILRQPERKLIRRVLQGNELLTRRTTQS